MKYKLKVYSIWEYGMRTDSEGKPHQEDSLYPAFGQQKDSDRTFILCDGMGGHDAGEVASATVCQAMGDYILNDGHDAEGKFTDEDLSGALKAAYDALDAKDNGSAKKMGTTMTFLKLYDGGATLAHIGDSRVYHIRPGKSGDETKILYQSEDHSLVNDLVKMGELTHEEARHSGQKNVITRAMQPLLNPRPRAEVYKTSDIQNGDFFYLCSDGMLEVDDMEDGTVLRRIFSNMVDSDERRVEILKGATNENRDNHTAFIVHILEVEGTPVPAEGEEKELPLIELVSKKRAAAAAAAAKAAAAAAANGPTPPPSAPMPHTPTPMATVDGGDDDDEEEEEERRSRGANTYLMWGVIAIALVALCFVGLKFILGDDAKKETQTPVEQTESTSSKHISAPSDDYYDGPSSSSKNRIEVTRQKDNRKDAKDGKNTNVVDPAVKAKQEADAKARQEAEAKKKEEETKAAQAKAAKAQEEQKKQEEKAKREAEKKSTEKSDL